MTRPDDIKKILSAMLVVIVLASLSVSLSACGKKPTNIDLPPGVETDYGTHVYPDPATDPKP
jgi:predicted small lipoprotein YifL